tara:strand:+ start:2098 stop:2313 length:216 start_codon:yes stop_codon:yes gene_type:complete
MTTNNQPILTFEGKKYDVNKLPKDIKELINGLQVAENQLKLHEDTLKILALGRNTLAAKLKEKLKDQSSIE